MKTLRHKARKLILNARELVFPDDRPPAHIAAAQARADVVWNEIFAPLNPMSADADILELGGYDGRLSAALLSSPIAGGAARSAVVLDEHAYWDGAEGGVAWQRGTIPERLELHDDLSHLGGLDPAAFDLILCRDFEAVFPLDELEQGMRRLYDLARPGAEALIVVRCADLDDPAIEGAGYGFMTPTSWIMLMMRAGFEIGEVRRVWRPAEAATTAAAVLPDASDDERMTAEMRCRLIRPWEAWELDGIWSS